MPQIKNNEKEIRQFSPWVGMWAFLAGCLLLAERLGWVSPDLKWGVPLLLMIFGVSVVFGSLRK